MGAVVVASERAELRGSVCSDPAQADPWVPPVSTKDKLHETEHMAFWQVRGSANAVCDGQQFRLSQGRLLWVPAGTWHSLHLAANSVVFPFSFPAERRAPHLEEVIQVDIDAEHEVILFALHQNESSALQSKADLSGLVFALIEAKLDGGRSLTVPQSPAARTVARGILNNPADDRGLQGWARATHTSERSIQRAFLAETGMTFGRWRAEQRMRTAKFLLEDGCTVSTAARRTGYLSVSSFTRAFRAAYGRAPSQVRMQQAQRQR